MENMIEKVDEKKELIALKQQSIKKYLVSGFRPDESNNSLLCQFIPKHAQFITIPTIIANNSNSKKYGIYNYKDGNSAYFSSSCANYLSISPLMFEDSSNVNSLRVGVSVIRLENIRSENPLSYSSSLIAIGGSNGIIRIFDTYDSFSNNQVRYQSILLQCKRFPKCSINHLFAINVEKLL